MADITLSQSTGSTLRSLQTSADLLTRSRERLAERSSTSTGTSTQSAGVTAGSLLNRAADLTQLSEAVSDAAETVKAATNGIDQIISLLQSAQDSLQDDSSDDGTSLADILTTLIQQINEVIDGSGYNGVNLLDGDSLSVSFNADGTSKLEIEGSDDTAAGLGLDGADEDSAATLLDKLSAAIGKLQEQFESLGSTLSQVETRQDFTQNMIEMLKTGASSLAVADIDEEGANLLALQTRQLLSSTNQSLTAEADQSVLRLL